jgi:hypothetical protein
LGIFTHHSQRGWHPFFGGQVDPRGGTAYSAFAEVSLCISRLIRKKAWIEPRPDELGEAWALLERAIRTLESLGADKQSAEAALERLLVRRRQLEFVGYEEARSDTIYNSAFGEAKRLIEVAGDNS